MTNGLLTAEVIFFCQIIRESLGRNSAGCISEQSATSQEIEFERWIIFFLFPSSLELHNDNVVTRNSKTHIRLPGTEGYPQTHLLLPPAQGALLWQSSVTAL